MGWHPLTPLETFLSALALVGQYLCKLLWPARLSAFYVFHPSTIFSQAPVLEGVGALVLCGWFLARYGSGARPASFGILWLLLHPRPRPECPVDGYLCACRSLLLSALRGILPGGRLGGRALVANGLERGKVLAIPPCWRAPVSWQCFASFESVTRVPDWHDDITLFIARLGGRARRVHPA